MTGAGGCDIVAQMRWSDRQVASREAMLDLGDEPTPARMGRYLTASRLLDLKGSDPAAPLATIETGDAPVQEEQ